MLEKLVLGQPKVISTAKDIDELEPADGNFLLPGPYQ